MATEQITAESLRVFLMYAKDAGNWNGTPMVDGSASERGNLTDLKRKGLITTFEDDGIQWINFTDVGKALAKTRGFDVAIY